MTSAGKLDNVRTFERRNVILLNLLIVLLGKVHTMDRHSGKFPHINRSEIVKKKKTRRQATF